MRTKHGDDAVTVVYDGDCPFCRYFVLYTKIKLQVGEVKLVNARDNQNIYDRYRLLGFDLNDGMIVEWGSQRFFGPDAMFALITIGSSRTIVVRVLLNMMKHPKGRVIVYSVLAQGRKSWLKIKRIAPFKQSTLVM
jgi:predicted DCC family thiol-disulfide oxidoreductase YuxK